MDVGRASAMLWFMSFVQVHRKMGFRVCHSGCGWNGNTNNDSALINFSLNKQRKIYCSIHFVANATKIK
jgi:hypothetical protein